MDAIHPDEDGVVRNVTVSLRSRDAREKVMLYRSRKPLEMIVGVKRLVLICPNEELGSCSEVNNHSITQSEVSSGASSLVVSPSDESRPGSGSENGYELQSLRKPGCRSTNGNGDKSKRLLGSPHMHGWCDCKILRRPDSGSENVDKPKNIRTPGSGSKKVVRVKVIPKAERIVDMR